MATQDLAVDPADAQARMATFNQLPEAAARDQLRRCLAVDRWLDELVSGRPYADLTALRERAAQAAAALTDTELAQALAGHPRLGDRQLPPGSDLSVKEQAGIQASASDATADALVEGNRAYEERFGRVFLLRAAGRTSAEVLAELRRRLANDDATERAETVANLREIALIRLDEVV
jgi:2-oxo-4-hydroxy-4-carboxy-5-ureidoimidazoline decarboxylase